MGIFDFLKNREDDFVKLESSDDSVFGPGPLLILYNIPHGLLDDELADMIEDGAPIASKSTGGIQFERIFPAEVVNEDDATIYGNMAVSEVLDSLLQKRGAEKGGYKNECVVDENAAPILYFSGVSNKEMMQTYNIIAKEIFEETQGKMNAACAKVVGPALNKRFKQLVTEISGDHFDAMNRN